MILLENKRYLPIVDHFKALSAPIKDFPSFSRFVQPFQKENHP